MQKAIAMSMGIPVSNSSTESYPSSASSSASSAPSSAASSLPSSAASSLPSSAPSSASSSAASSAPASNNSLGQNINVEQQLAIEKNIANRLAKTRKASASAKPKAPVERALPAFKPEDYLQFDTIGDGNCFYRSLYNAAKFHIIPGTFERLLRCLGLPAAITEKAFSDQLRRIVAQRIRGDILKDIAKAEAGGKRGFTIYHSIRQRAKEVARAEEPNSNLPKKQVDKDLQESMKMLWELLKRDASTEFRKELLKSPKYFLSLTEQQFKDKLASIIAQDCVFVSELDITIIDFILGHCGPNSVILKRMTPADIFVPADEVNGVPIIYVRRVGNHYNFFVKGSKFLETPSLVQAAKFGSASQAIQDVFTMDRSAAIAARNQYAAEEKRKQDILKAMEAAAKAAADAKAKAADAKAKAAAAKGNAASAVKRQEAAKAIANSKTQVAVTRSVRKSAAAAAATPSSSNSNSSGSSIPSVGRRRTRNSQPATTTTTTTTTVVKAPAPVEEPVNSANEFQRTLTKLREERAASAAAAKAGKTTQKKKRPTITVNSPERLLSENEFQNGMAKLKALKNKSKATAAIPEPPMSKTSKDQLALAAALKPLARKNTTRKTKKKPVVSSNNNTTPPPSSNSN